MSVTNASVTMQRLQPGANQVRPTYFEMLALRFKALKLENQNLLRTVIMYSITITKALRENNVEEFECNTLQVPGTSFKMVYGTTI